MSSFCSFAAFIRTDISAFIRTDSQAYRRTWPDRSDSDPDQEYIYAASDPDQEYIYVMGSETLPFTCYILSDKSIYPFTLRVTGITM